MDIENLITGYVSELDKVTNKDQAKEVATKLIQALRDLAVTDSHSLAQTLYGQISEKDILITGLNDKIIARNIEITDLKGALIDAEETASDAVAKFNEAAPQLAKPSTVKLGKQIVQVNHSVRLRGIDYSVVDLVENSAIVEELLKMGSSAVNLTEGK